MNVSGNGRTVADVAVDITVECVDDHGRRHEIDTVLGYRRQDPYAVTMTFITGDGDLTWTFGRDLLSRGLSSPTGDGDVQVAPALGRHGRAMVHVDLSSPDGTLGLLARSDEVRGFLGRTFDVVADGDEASLLDLDLLIDQIFAA